MSFKELNLALDQLNLAYIAHRGSAALREKIIEGTSLDAAPLMVALENFKLLSGWLRQESRRECILPNGDVVCSPRFKKPPSIDFNRCYSTLM